MSYSATWTKLSQGDELKRSSVCTSAVGSNIYFFGGELQPRQPRDNNIHKISLNGGTERISVATLPTPPSSSTPSPRVGAATTALADKIYMFSGRGGEAMAPIDEAGSLWVFDSTSSSWSSITPTSTTAPEPRSYHSMTNNGSDTIYLHAGCPEKGRLSDLWAFHVPTSAWKQLASAPDPPRGGPSIAFAKGKVYRMNGFDGKTEQGGALDVYDPVEDGWESVEFRADGKEGPGARSVSVLVPVSVGGDVLLVTLFGESDPSSLGHQGAGKMLSDGWAYSLENAKWSQISFGKVDVPEARGWFDADRVSLDGRDCVAIVGGLGESNERLDDAWLLALA